MVIIWTENAQNDLFDYKKNSKIITNQKIENYISSLIDYVENLKNFSKLGKFLFIKNNYEVRQLIYKMHRIFYAISNDKIYILNIYHTARNINIFFKDLENYDLI